MENQENPCAAVELPSSGVCIVLEDFDRVNPLETEADVQAAAEEIESAENAEFISKAEGLIFRNTEDIQPVGISLVAEPTENNTGVVIGDVASSKRLRGETSCIAHIDEAGFYKIPDANAGIGDGLAPPEHGSDLNALEKRILVVGSGDLNVLTLNATESFDIMRNEVKTIAPTTESENERSRLYRDEEWQREGNNKKWRSPAVEKNRKKMAKASKKRNRR